MVDINLLDDDETPQYRPEKSEFQEPYDFEESSEETEEISGDEAWEEEPSEDDPVYGNYDTPRSKAFLYIAIPLVIIAIFAAIYIWQPFFKKGGETESTPMTQIDSAQEFTEESPEPEAAVSSEVTPMEAFTDNVTSLITQVSPGDKLLNYVDSSCGLHRV